VIGELIGEASGGRGNSAPPLRSGELRESEGTLDRCSPKPREVRQAGMGSGWNLVQLRGFYAYAVAAVSVAPDPAA